MIPTRATDETAPGSRISPRAESTARKNRVRRIRTDRRGFVYTVGTVGLIGPTAGCLENLGSSDDSDYPDSFDDDGDPEYGDWFDDVDNYDGTVDARDEDEVEIAVGANGGLAFDPPAVLITPGMTVRWEWSGGGGSHDVVHVDGAFESDRTREAGHIFEHAFDESGVYRYVCEPHRRAGMKGAIAVADRE